MGHTVDPEEFLNDYAKSKSSTEKLAEFKMYRLNIWQHTANPWLKMSAWNKCADRRINEEQLRGRSCFGGLDIARVYDMTALVLVFPPEGDDERWLFVPYFWMPEETAAQRSALAPYATWEKSKALTLTEGDWGDDEPVRQTMNAANRMFRIRKVAYDKHYADSLIQRLIREDGWETEQFADFPQNHSNYTGPTDEFERLVISGEMAHPANPVFDWQASHVVLQRDRNKGKKPVKPKKGDFRTVDGIQAGVMALGVAMVDDGSGGRSIYEQPGALSL